MANQITSDEIILMNELYVKYKSYAAVARETGRAPSTVKKYINKDYVPQSQLVKKIFKLIDIKEPFDEQFFLDNDDWGNMALLTDDEKEDIKDLWKEISI